MDTHSVGNKNSTEEQQQNNQGDENISLVDAVTAMLSEAGHPHPYLWRDGLHPDALTTPDKNIQRFLINRYWRLQIQRLDEDTMNVRYCLADEAHIRWQDYLRIFKEGVLPCILKHQLPLPSNMVN